MLDDVSLSPGLLPDTPVVVVLVVGPVAVVHVVVVHGPLARVVLRGGLPHVGHHLGPGLHLVVAVLHGGAGLGPEEGWFPNAVDEVVLGPGVAADTARHGVLAEHAAVLGAAPVRVEVHVSQLEDSSGPELSAHHARLESPVGVDDVHESRGLLGDDVLSQLRDGVHVGTVHEPGSCRVQTLMED